MTTSLRTELTPEDVALVSRLGVDAEATLDAPLSDVSYCDLEALRHRIAGLLVAEGLADEETLNDFRFRCEALIDRLAPWHWRKTPTSPPYAGPVSGTIAWIAWIGDDDPVLPHDVTKESGIYTGYVGALDGDGREVAMLEEMPELRDITAVLDWVRERSDHGRVRPSWNPSETYFVGDPAKNPGLPLLDVPTGHA